MSLRSELEKNPMGSFHYLYMMQELALRGAPYLKTEFDDALRETHRIIVQAWKAYYAIKPFEGRLQDMNRKIWQHPRKPLSCHDIGLALDMVTVLLSILEPPPPEIVVVPDFETVAMEENPS